MAKKKLGWFTNEPAFEKQMKSVTSRVRPTLVQTTAPPQRVTEKAERDRAYGSVGAWLFTVSYLHKHTYTHSHTVTYSE
jgi:hypothetical protein